MQQWIYGREEYLVERAPESRALKSRWLAGEEDHPTEGCVWKARMEKQNGLLRN